MIDLHTHSRSSDGEYLPAELVRLAAAEGITVMALTDHDTISGLSEAMEEARKIGGIEVIPGIEISVQDVHQTHILGYGVDADSAELKQFYEDNRTHRLRRRERLLQLLHEEGIDITLEDILRINNGKSAGRPHFAKALTELGYTSSVQEAFDRYLETPKFHIIERPKPTAAEGIAMIRRAGGIAVLAHPYSMKLEGKALCEKIEELISYGLCGIECYYSTHTPQQMEAYCKIARRYGLICTCGSDYHGPTMKPDIMLGRGREDSLVHAHVPEEEILAALYSLIG